MKNRLLFFFFISTFSFAFGATEKYRLAITDDPSTTMTIGWNQLSGHSVAVFYDVVDHGTDIQAYENFQLPDRTVVYKGMNNYFVNLKNLQPNTAYYFVIADSEGVSRRFWFRTLPDDPSIPLSIIAGGDSRRSGSATTPHEPRIQSNKIVRAVRPDFVAFGGDYTDKNTDGQWQTWMDDWQYTTGEDGLMIPILATRGNHERSNEDIINLFNVPHEDVYYAVNFGGSLIRFYTLNVMISVAGDQTNWLANDLMQNDDATIWKLAQYHYPIAPHQSGKTYKTTQYIHWVPLFHQHGMHMVVECDSHIARNSWPIKPSDEAESDGGFVRDDETGTVFTGEGSWGLIRTADVSYSWTRDKGSFTQVKWIQATMDSLTVYTIKSATSNPVETVDDNDRFQMVDSLDLWVTEHGDHFVIKRPNPKYNFTTSTSSKLDKSISLIENIFPNPGQSHINVVLKSTQRLLYQVFDNQGQTLKTGLLQDINTRIDIDNFAAGIYYLKVQDPDNAKKQFEVKSFIKN